LPGRRSSPQQTTDFHRTMAKVCKSGGEGTFAERHGNGEVAPIADLHSTRAWGMPLDYRLSYASLPEAG
jgi:hypothetical protein